MSKLDKPYTAIPGYFDKSPQELTAPGEAMEYSKYVTAIGRSIVGAMVNQYFIEPEDLVRYQSVGPAVLVPPHRSTVDLSAMSELGVRSGEGQPYFLSKRENMNNPLTARFMGQMRTFPIGRDMDDPRWATIFGKWSRFALTDEKMKLVIFGEGGRKDGPTVQEMFSGPLVAAKRNKVPIIPIGIYGTDAIKIRKGRFPVQVTVGEPYMVTDMKATEELRLKVQEQHDRANLLLAQNIS
jgi:1-acyl-sn-glycerol-3-phosphate acyltransferase